MEATRGLTPSQTVGPFFLGCLLRDGALRTNLATSDTAGERIRIEGRILDGDGAGVPDAVIEIWQADSLGRYACVDREHPDPGATFIGFGRSGTNEEGWYGFDTIKPGSPAPAASIDAVEAPHISVVLFARGLLNHVATRLYFAGETLNEGDNVLACVPPSRRATLIARPVGKTNPIVYRWDVVLQGPGETVFFNL